MVMGAPISVWRSLLSCRFDSMILILQDLYACVDYIQSELNISQPELTVLVGRSAGALPVSMFCNQWPHKIQAALLQVTNSVMNILLSSSLLFLLVSTCQFSTQPVRSFKLPQYKRHGRVWGQWWVRCCYIIIILLLTYCCYFSLQFTTAQW